MIKHTHIKTILLNISMVTHVNDGNYIYFETRTCLEHVPPMGLKQGNLVPDDLSMAEDVVVQP